MILEQRKKIITAFQNHCGYLFIILKMFTMNSCVNLKFFYFLEVFKSTIIFHFHKEFLTSKKQLPLKLYQKFKVHLKGLMV